MNEELRQKLIDIRDAYLQTMDVIHYVKIGFDPDTDTIDKALDEVVAPLVKIWRALPDEIKRAL